MKTRKQDEELLLYSQGQLAFLTSQRQRKKAVIWSRIILSIGFLVLWQMASDFEWIDDFYFSSPRAIGILFLQDLQDMSLLRHIGMTLWESVVSFLLIVIFSLILATLFWFLPGLGHTFEPFLIVLNSLPKSALAPLIIVWLGTGQRQSYSVECQ